MARDIRSGRNSVLQQLANKQNTMNDTVILKCSNLVEYPDNEYLFGMEGIDRLAEGIKQNGFKGAIEVWDMGDGTYTIYSGCRRFRANKMLGNETIKAFVYPLPESETVRRRQFLGANIYGRNAVAKGDPIHTARQMNYLRATIMMERNAGTYEGEKTREELAKEFGTNPSTVYKYESLLSLNERAQQAIIDGELQIGQGSSMAVLKSEYQDLILDAMQLMKEKNVISGRDEVQELVNYVKNHDGEAMTADVIVDAVCGKWDTPVNANETVAQEAEGEAATVNEAESDGNEVTENADGTTDTADTMDSESDEKPKKYTSKAAAKKFNQCYGKMEEFLRADKKYKEQDREDVLSKLQQLKDLIESEITKIEETEN